MSINEKRKGFNICGILTFTGMVASLGDKEALRAFGHTLILNILISGNESKEVVAAIQSAIKHHFGAEPPSNIKLPYIKHISGVVAECKTKSAAIRGERNAMMNVAPMVFTPGSQVNLEVDVACYEYDANKGVCLNILACQRVYNHGLTPHKP